jgi:hypothetical protein
MFPPPPPLSEQEFYRRLEKARAEGTPTDWQALDTEFTQWHERNRVRPWMFVVVIGAGLALLVLMGVMSLRNL